MSHKNIKLMIVTPSLRGGGAERIAVNLANQYADMGLDVFLLAFKAVGPYKDQLSDSVKLIELGTDRTLSVIPPLIRTLKKEMPTHALSVMRGSNVPLGLATFFCKECKVFFREANTMNSIYALPVLRRWVWLLLMKVSYRRAEAIVANSLDTRNDLLSNGMAVRDKIKVIVNPVLPLDYELKSKEDLDHRWFSDRELRVILSVGRLHRQKNHELLLKAFEIVSKKNIDARLVILGSGEERTRLSNLADELGISDLIDIIPFKENPYPYYRGSDVFVLTSDWEGFGNVIVESLACGTPVISTNCVGGPKEILEYGKYGKLVKVGDVEELAVAIHSVLAGREMFCTDALIRRAGDYTIESVSKLYLELMMSGVHKVPSKYFDENDI